MTIRHDWTPAEVAALFERPLNDLLFDAQATHRRHFDPNAVQVSALLSIKTGACPEDCGYCPQSAHHATDLEKERLLACAEVVTAAGRAKAAGATRFCMGAAWRSPNDRDFEHVIGMLREVKGLGLETCMTLGMLSETQAQALAAAGLDYYNHNIDTSPEHYRKIVSTRTFGDRIATLEKVRAAGIKVCCGGIVGMGEAAGDRAGLLLALANMTPPPESVPINALVPIEGTPLGRSEPVPAIEFARLIAVARILMPASYVRLSAGRDEMSDEAQALCFLAGANSIFVGERLLTTDNPGGRRDAALFEQLGIRLV
jgi:biotin synthase